MGDHTPLLMRMVDTPPPSASVSASASATPEMIGLPTPLAPNTQPKMPHAQTPIEEEEEEETEETEVLKVSGVKLYQLIFTDEYTFDETKFNTLFEFDETKFNEIFEEAERQIFEHSKTPEGTSAFNISGTVIDGKTVLKTTRDITKEIKSIPPIIKDRAKTILKYFLKNHLITPNVFEHNIKYGVYKVISFAIIEYFLKMYEWDNIFDQIHRNPFRFRYDPYILQDVSRFITGMVSRFRIEPDANPAVSQEISDMMNFVIGEIVRSATTYGGKMSKRSIKHKRMKQRTVKRMKRRTVKRMKRRTVKRIKKVLVN